MHRSTPINSVLDVEISIKPKCAVREYKAVSPKRQEKIKLMQDRNRKAKQEQRRIRQARGDKFDIERINQPIKSVGRDHFDHQDYINHHRWYSESDIYRNRDWRRELYREWRYSKPKRHTDMRHRLKKNHRHVLFESGWTRIDS